MTNGCPCDDYGVRHKINVFRTSDKTPREIEEKCMNCGFYWGHNSDE